MQPSLKNYSNSRLEGARKITTYHSQDCWLRPRIWKENTFWMCYTCHTDRCRATLFQSEWIQICLTQFQTGLIAHDRMYVENIVYTIPSLFTGPCFVVSLTCHRITVETLMHCTISLSQTYGHTCASTNDLICPTHSIHMVWYGTHFQLYFSQFLQLTVALMF